MKELTISLEQESIHPGDTVSGQLVLRIDKHVKSRALRLEFSGQELVQMRRPLGESGSKDYLKEQQQIVSEEQELFRGTSIPPGESHCPFSFQIPKDATPSYNGKFGTVEYTLRARLDIPLRPDLRAEKSVTVLARPPEREEELAPLKVESEGKGSAGFVVELEKEWFHPGERLFCDFHIENPAGKKLDTITVKQLATERATAQGMVSEAVVGRERSVIRLERSDAHIPFRTSLMVPRDAALSHRGALSRVDWEILFELAFAGGETLRARHRLNVSADPARGGWKA